MVQALRPPAKVEKRSWTITHHEKVWTLNAERTWHWRDVRRRTREWREAWYILALSVPLPHGLDRIRVTATPIRASRAGGSQDVAACFPAVKAAIDGLIDAGLCVNDGPAHVVELTFRAPRTGKFHGLELVIEEV